MNIKTMNESLHDRTEQAAEGVRDLKDDVLQSAQDAVETTREAADRGLDQAAQHMQDLRAKADPVIDELAAKAQDLAHRSIDYCAEASARARQQMQLAADATTRYVIQQPGKSMAIAAAAGALLATLCLSMSRRRHSTARDLYSRLR